MPDYLTRLQLGLLGWIAIWRKSCASQSGATSTGPPGLAAPMAQLVTPNGLARLQLGLLGWSVTWRYYNRAKQSGATTTEPPGLVAPLARVVTPDGLA
jgi:hypothetical protein